MGRHRAPHQRPPGWRPVAAAVASLVVLVGYAVLGTTANPAGSGSAPFALGVTFTQHTLSGSDAAARASATRVLASSASWQTHPLMGWGNPNPEPEPGVYDWSGLDAGVAVTTATGGVPVLTLCCAPDWMKGGRVGETDWSNLSAAPTPAHYRDFAQLAVAAARRYPQVRYFNVWNEMKGWWSRDMNRWRFEDYTIFYNTVYDALHRFDPGLNVGGPYVRINAYARPSWVQRSSVNGCWGTVDQRDLDAIRYWLDHKHGAQYVTVDGGTRTRDGRLTCGPLAANDKFAAVTSWIRSHTALPVWWTEISPAVKKELRPDDPRRAQVFEDALRKVHAAGANAAFLWGPEEHGSGSAALWSSTDRHGGGRPLPLAARFRSLTTEFGPARADAVRELQRQQPKARPRVVVQRRVRHQPDAD